MKVKYNNRPVYAELEYGRHSGVDTFIQEAYFLDGDMEFLTEAQLDELQDLCSDDICSEEVQRYGYFRK